MREVTELHTRIMRCDLELTSTRAWWAHRAEGAAADPQKAYEEMWFGPLQIYQLEVCRRQERLEPAHESLAVPKGTEDNRQKRTKEPTLIRLPS